ncbi:MAG: hypothetical protein ACI4DK_12715 [Lachnospiraceae bacterium]
MGEIYFSTTAELTDFIIYENIKKEQILDIGVENGEFVLKLSNLAIH